jgi:hypothetical protein
LTEIVCLAPDEPVAATAVMDIMLLRHVFE